MSVDTLLNWADIGTKTHTSERLTSLLRQMPLLLGEEQKQALACPVKSNENSSRGHGGDGEDSIQKCDGCHGEEDRDGCLQSEDDDTLLVIKNFTVPQRLLIELFQQSRKMWNGLFMSAIVTTTLSVDSFHSEL